MAKGRRHYGTVSPKVKNLDRREQRAIRRLDFKVVDEPSASEPRSAEYHEAIPGARRA
jgi:hypothetical protein